MAIRTSTQGRSLNTVGVTETLCGLSCAASASERASGRCSGVAASSAVVQRIAAGTASTVRRSSREGFSVTFCDEDGTDVSLAPIIVRVASSILLRRTMLYAAASTAGQTIVVIARAFVNFVP